MSEDVLHAFSRATGRGYRVTEWVTQPSGHAIATEWEPLPASAIEGDFVDAYESGRTLRLRGVGT